METIDRTEPGQLAPVEATTRAAYAEGAESRPRWGEIARQRPEVAFAVAACVMALHAMASRAVYASGRAAIARIADTVVPLTAAGAAMAVFRRSGPLTRALLALVIGASATVAGAGLTVPHMVKVGPSAADLTGLASLASGLVLLALGTFLILEPVRGWRRLLAIPIGILIGYYVVAALTIAVYVTHVPPTVMSGLTPADKGLAYREVALTTRDGVRLSGWYLPSRNRAGVVVLHGAGSTRSNMLDHAVALARRGYGVLAFDARGHGRSGGEAMDLGWYGDLDVDAAVSFLARQPDVDPDRIAALGLSMGGAEAVTAAASDPRIRAVVAEGLSVHSYQDALSLGAGEWLRLPFYWVTTTAADVMTPAEPPMALEDAIARIIPRPLLLLSGKDRTESSLNRRFAALGTAVTELWELPDTPHTEAIWWHPDQWARRVGGFLDRALLG